MTGITQVSPKYHTQSNQCKIVPNNDTFTIPFRVLLACVVCYNSLKYKKKRTIFQ